MTRSTFAFTYSPIGSSQATTDGLPAPPQWWTWTETGTWHVAHSASGDVVVSQWMLVSQGSDEVSYTDAMRSRDEWLRGSP